MSAYPASSQHPNIARVYDYWLGGKHHLPPDRVMAEQIMRRWPEVPRMVRSSRWFLGRAVGYVAGQGISQFADLGSGLPALPGVHEKAREIIPAARVAYVDDDPVVMDYARAILAGDEAAAGIPGDLRDPAAVYADPEFTRIIDFSQPACVVLSMVLHFFPADEAALVAREAIRPLAPGSYVIVSAGYADEQSSREFRDMYTAAQLHLHPRGEWDRWLGGLEVVTPGVADVTELNPGKPLGRVPQRTRGVMGAVARVP